MNTAMTWQTNSINSEATEQLAEKLAIALRGGEVIELVSDLGGGKSTFTRGLVRGLGSPDKVASPTFTISKVYQSANLQVHHFDFYRLHEAGIIADELAEVAGEPDIVTVVEWGDVVQHVLPDKRLTVLIKQQPDGTREIAFRCHEVLAYLIEAVQE